MTDHIDNTPAPTSDMAPDFDTFEPGAIPEHIEIQNLTAAVLARVVSYFVPAGVPVDMIESYAKELVRDIEDGLDKFAKGQAEHGGDIRDRDILNEERSELLDLGNYSRARRLQRAFIRLTS